MPLYQITPGPEFIDKSAYQIETGFAPTEKWLQVSQVLNQAQRN